MYKKYFSTIMIILLITTCSKQSKGCDAIIAGKAATADGCVLFAHNEDNSYTDIAVTSAGLCKRERMHYTDGGWIDFPEGGRIPQVKTTYEYWYMNIPGLSYADTVLNEFGVAVASDNCPSREDNPEFTDGGIGSPGNGSCIFRHLVAQRACTAREGVKLVGALVEQFGYQASGRTLSICDPNEGWMVSLVKGKHWVAARIPDDMVAVVSNTYSIREVDLADTLNYLGSKDLIEYAIKRGWYDPDDGPFSFEESYADRKARVADSNTHRQWSSLNHLSAEPVPLPEEFRLPFAVKPKVPLTVQHLTEIMRDHYEDTPYEPGKGYKSNPAHQRHTSTICGPYTNFSSIIQLRSWMPVEIGAVLWIALWQPCSTIYIPLYAGMSCVPEQLEYGTYPDKDGILEFSTAYKVFSDLARWVDEDYASRISLVRKQWQAMENASFVFQKPFEDNICEHWNSQPDLARELMNRYSHGVVAHAVQEAKVLMEDNNE